MKFNGKAIPKSYILFLKFQLQVGYVLGFIVIASIVLVGLLVYYVGVMNVADELDNCLSTTAATSTTSQPVKEKVFNSTVNAKINMTITIQNVGYISLIYLIDYHLKIVLDQRCAFANSFEPHSLSNKSGAIHYTKQLHH